MTGQRVRMRGESRQTSSNPESVVWFISFGDLLTLLLCFFLVLTPWQAWGRKRLTHENQDVTPQNAERAPLGTAFAQDAARKVSEVVAEIPLFEDAVSSDSAVSSALLLSTMEQELAPYLTSDGLVLTVVACSPESGRRDVVKRVAPLALSPEFSRMTFRTELVTSCSEARILRPTTAKMVGSIRVTRM